MANRLNQKLRKPAQDKTAPVNYDPLHPASRTLPQQTADGQLTFAGVYCTLWPKLRRSIMTRYIPPAVRYPSRRRMGN